MKPDFFDYQLPDELIAAHPPTERDGGRLLVLGPKPDRLAHASITELTDYLPRDALLVANDTRVIPARLHCRRPTGGAVELLLVRLVEEGETASVWSTLARANKPLRPGDQVSCGDLVAEIETRGERGDTTVRFAASGQAVKQVLQSVGEVPLPPYIKRAPEKSDRARYQTVYARHDGSVAAPTAGLHLTEAALAELKARGNEIAFITLHVGPGTFRPIVVDDIAEHRMDEEQYLIEEAVAAKIDRAKSAGRPVIAVGTTTVRALEGAYATHGTIEACSGFTDLFITPGFTFNAVDGLLTNFHLPRSTLLCLVCALAGEERIRRAYTAAVQERYRFYSYGDAMLILPSAEPPRFNP